MLRVLSHGWESTGVWYSSCLADRSWYGECLVELFDGSSNLISGDNSFDDIRFSTIELRRRSIHAWSGRTMKMSRVKSINIDVEEIVVGVIFYICQRTQGRGFPQYLQNLGS